MYGTGIPTKFVKGLSLAGYMFPVKDDKGEMRNPNRMKRFLVSWVAILAFVYKKLNLRKAQLLGFLRGVIASPIRIMLVAPFLELLWYYVKRTFRQSLRTDNEKRQIQKRVAIVGAGPSGLVACKEMLEAGHDVICLERNKGIGGCWAADSKIAYDGLYQTTSSYFSAFSDFPPPDGEIKYWRGDEYRQYLDQYAARYKLLEHIQFQCSVLNVEECVENDGSKYWKLKYVDAEGNVNHCVADNLIMAVGAFQPENKKLPDLKGYTGKVVHSADYVNNKEFAGKRVLVIGVGESSADVTTDISEVAKSTTVWSRRPFMIAPRYPNKTLFTKDFSESDALVTGRDSKNNMIYKAADFLESATTHRIGGLLPLYLFAILRRGMIGFGGIGLMGKGLKQMSVWATLGMGNGTTKLMGDQSLVVTKSSRMSQACSEGKMDVVVSKTAEFFGTDVVFPDSILRNMEEFEKPQSLIFKDIDVIVCCTGFKPVPMKGLEHIDLDVRSWYKNCFVPGYDDRLAFLGYARPHQGGLVAVSEMLARYCALLARGDRKLPKNYAELAKVEGGLSDAYFSQAHQTQQLVDYPSFMASLAKLVGCEPDMPSPFNFSLFARYWTFADWPVWYRQRGPGANPEALKQLMSTCRFQDHMCPEYAMMLVAEILFLFPFLPLYRIYSVLEPLIAIGEEDVLHPGWMYFRRKIDLLHSTA